MTDHVPPLLATESRINNMRPLASGLFLQNLLPAIIDRPDDSVVRRGRRPIAQGYGEVTFAFIELFIERFALTATDTFVDIGSGTGNVIIHVAARTGADAVGFDNTHMLVDEGAHNIRLVNYALRVTKKTMGHAYSIYADAQEPLPWPSAIAPASMIMFMDNFLFSDVLSTNIMTNIVKDPRVLPETRILLARPIQWSRQESDTELFRHFATVPELFVAPPGSVSWQPRGVIAMVLYTTRARAETPAFTKRAYKDFIADRGLQYRNIGERPQ